MADDHPTHARALLEAAGVDVDQDELEYRGYVPKVVRLCLACGERHTRKAKPCPRCGGSTLIEGTE